MKKTQSGFTLIELSIVIIIIAILIGGIMVGQSLLRNSQLRSLTAEIANYTQAAANFRDKYQELPGDFSRASSQWSGETNGDGDGWINGVATVTPQNEQFLAWRHLGLAQLIDGNYSGTAGSAGPRDRTPGINVPASKLSNGGLGLTSVSLSTIATNPSILIPYTAPDSAPNHILWVGGTVLKPGAVDVSYAPVLRVDEAFELDRKMDDEFPTTGKIVAQKDTNLATCVSGGSYLMTATGLQCSLIFKTGF